MPTTGVAGSRESAANEGAGADLLGTCLTGLRQPGALNRGMRGLHIPVEWSGVSAPVSSESSVAR